MSFSSQPPSDMRFQLQSRNQLGDSPGWVAIYIYFPIANFVAVSVNKQTIQPILASSDEDVMNRTDQCGTNKFFYINGTIAFIVNGNSGCQVRVTITNNIQVTARLQTTVEEFFNNGGVTKFVDRMCAILNITTDRLKVVGVYSGSAVVQYYVIQQNVASSDPNDPNSSNGVTQAQSQAELTALSKQIAAAAANNVQLDGLGAILSASTVVNIINDDGTAYVPPTVVTPNATMSTAVMIAIICSCVLGAVLIGVGTFLIIRWYRMKKSKITI
jgi:hypothetical protein